MRGNDTVDGDKSDDLIAGGPGADMLKGGNGDDIITDGTGDDVSNGGNGNDLLIDSAGADDAFVENASDVFIFTKDAIFGRETNDMIGFDTLVLRLDDPTMKFGAVQKGKATVYAEFSLITTGIRQVIVVNSTELPEIAGLVTAFQTVDVWHFV